MSLGEGGDQAVGFETMRGRNWPTVTQFSVFLENRVRPTSSKSSAASNGSSEGQDRRPLHLRLGRLLHHPADPQPPRAGARDPLAEQAGLRRERAASRRAAGRPAVAGRPLHHASCRPPRSTSTISLHLLIVHPHGRAAAVACPAHRERRAGVQHPPRQRLRRALRGRPVVVGSAVRTIFGPRPESKMVRTADPTRTGERIPRLGPSPSWGRPPLPRQARAAARTATWSNATPRASSTATHWASAASSRPWMRGRGDRTTAAWAIEIVRPRGSRAASTNTPMNASRLGHGDPGLLLQFAWAALFEGLAHVDEAAGDRPTPREGLPLATDQQDPRDVLLDPEDHEVDRDGRVGIFVGEFGHENPTTHPGGRGEGLASSEVRP